MTYCVVPYKNGAKVKGFSWNWIGAGMTVYFNFVVVSCKPNGKQHFEIYGPKVQGANNTAVKLTAAHNTYYTLTNNCGCQDLEFKLNCGSTLGVLIRGIEKSVQSATVQTTSLQSSSAVSTTALQSKVVNSLILDNLDHIREIDAKYDQTDDGSTRMNADVFKVS